MEFEPYHVTGGAMAPGKFESSLRGALDGAVEFARSAQHADGFWEEVTDARIFDTAVVTICLASIRLVGRETIRKAQRWLIDAKAQQHDEFVMAVEQWLRGLVTGDRETQIPAISGERAASSGRALLIEMVAVGTGVRGSDPERLLKKVTAVGSRAELKQWQRALLASADILARARLGLDVPSRLVRMLAREQGPGGDFCLMPAVTALAVLALNLSGHANPAEQRGLDHLLRTQRTDGTWRYLSFDIWDTTLMVRSLRGVPAFDNQLLPPALDFISRTQSADGGWACKRGLESDNDTTASALLALSGTRRGDDALRTAARYLQRVQRPDGLWTTWQSADDLPSSDVTAHVVAALAAYPDSGVENRRAAAWLVSQSELPGGCTAQWYPNKAYAVAETAAAVGWRHQVTLRAARVLAGQQLPDGGWPVRDGEVVSASAVTGLALTTIIRSGLQISRAALAKAVSYLLERQTTRGTWPGVPIMAGPRPFLNHCPHHTHAFVAAGLRDVLHRNALHEAS